MTPLFLPKGRPTTPPFAPSPPLFCIAGMGFAFDNPGGWVPRDRSKSVSFLGKRNNERMIRDLGVRIPVEDLVSWGRGYPFVLDSYVDICPVFALTCQLVFGGGAGAGIAKEHPLASKHWLQKRWSCLWYRGRVFVGRVVAVVVGGRVTPEKSLFCW